jgi:hypothetical protein
MRKSKDPHYITVRVTTEDYEALCRARLHFARDLDSGLELSPDPGGSFPSLSWTLGYLARKENALRESCDTVDKSPLRNVYPRFGVGKDDPANP